MTLYELTATQKEIEDALMDNGGEITEEIEALIAETAETLPKKIDGYNAIIRNMDSSIVAIDAEIKRLTQMKKTLTNSQTNIKEHLKFCMDSFGYKRLDGKLCKAILGSTKSLEVDEETYLKAFLEENKEVIDRLISNAPLGVTIDFKTAKTPIKAAYKDSDILPQGCTIIEKKTLTLK